MKRILTIITFLIIMVVCLNAEGVKTIKIDAVRTDDKVKIGVVLGYPTGLTAGWSLSDSFELNLVVATHYTDFTVGVLPMFTVVNLNIADEIFPLSIGPAAYLNISWWGGIDLDILGNVRIEYSFKQIPLNLFLEGGLGIKLDLGNTPLVYPQGSGALGVRYIF
ncbi:MAG: hypothetical protein PF518_10070 [Spirochaetaceae bacterium]|jgi:hypothetical protein|nr:hypothetical protein [Spirochaetaceae bacterium]